jgi:hypothetical protein
MIEYKKLLVSSVGVVIFLLASFSGFLKNIAPPDQAQTSTALGMLSFFVLILLLMTKAISRSVPTNRYRNIWIIVGAIAFLCAIPPSIIYPQELAKYTWSYPPENPIRRLRGLDTEYTDNVILFLKKNPTQNSPEILAHNFEIDQIWDDKALARASTKLLILYSWLVLSLAISIFSLLEASTAKATRGG